MSPITTLNLGPNTQLHFSGFNNKKYHNGLKKEMNKMILLEHF